MKKVNLFPLGILAAIIGVALYKEFDFATFKFRNWGLGIIYLVTFSSLVYIILKGKTDKE